MDFISQVSDHLRQTEAGIWVSPIDASVSYPEYGNEWCLGVEDKSFWFIHRNACILRLLQAFTPGRYILDVGGGNGFVAATLLEAGYEVAVLEPGKDGARNARDRGIQVVINSSFEEAYFRDNSLPSVGLFDVLEHIFDDQGFIKTLSDKMIPGGNLYMTVPASPYLWSREDIEAGHFRRYTSRGLAVLFQNCGLELQYCSHFFIPLVLPIFFFRVLPYRLHSRKGVNLNKTRNELSPGTPKWNSFLAMLLTYERWIIGRKIAFPFGSSLIAVARKNLKKPGTK